MPARTTRATCAEQGSGLLRFLRGALPWLDLEPRVALSLLFEIGCSVEETAEILEIGPRETEGLARFGLRRLHHLLAGAGWERLPDEIALALAHMPPLPVPQRLRERLEEILNTYVPTDADARRQETGPWTAPPTAL
jgi:hypothetical protein